MTLLPPPSTYGLPERYSAWRPHQDQAVIATCSSERPYAAIVAPTGFGKTITGATIAKFIGGRSLYVVETKSLMDQIERDLPNQFFKIWGKNNYPCRLLLENGFAGWQARCDKAESLCSHCSYRETGCDYYDAVRKAGRMDSDLTNYSFWLSVNRYTDEGIGDFSTIVFDEAHKAMEKLGESLRIELSAKDCERHLKERLPGVQALDEWATWAGHRMGGLAVKAEGLELIGTDESRRESAELKILADKLRGMAAMGDDWIEDRGWKNPDEATAFEPVWPARYRSSLFRRAKKYLLMSATIRPKTMELLGLAPEEFDFLEYPSSFPVERRPVIYVPCVRQHKGMSIGDQMKAVRKIDEIIDGRLDRKGVVHTVSFDRAQLVMEHSRHSKNMILTGRGRQAQEDIERFKRSAPGTVLVGPNFDTGVDLPYTDCEYQIIMKVPFPDTRSPVMKARCASDDEYRNYLAMTSIVQMAGRGMRAEDDRCETLIIDDQWGDWFLRNNNRFAPLWFLQACRREKWVPAAPERLEMSI
jgi:ATP-dependent DNA helicase DinG